MALVKGTNSYVTVAEAEFYFETRIDVAAWTSASSSQKESALVTATMILDTLSWTGVAVSASQPLAFPREGSYYDSKVGEEVLFTSNTPDRVIKATYELAYHLLNNDGLLDDTGTVINLSIESIKLDRIISSSKIPTFVRNLIRPLLVNSGSRLWWRAN
jgi:hypothetical protein